MSVRILQINKGKNTLKKMEADNKAFEQVHFFLGLPQPCCSFSEMARHTMAGILVVLIFSFRIPFFRRTTRAALRFASV